MVCGLMGPDIIYGACEPSIGPARSRLHTHGLRCRAQVIGRGLFGPGGCSWATNCFFSSKCAKYIHWVFVAPRISRVRSDARRVWFRPREGCAAAAVFRIAIAITVELSLHLGLYQHLELSAHATVPVVLLGCVSVARALRLCVMWTPLPSVLLV